MIARVQVVVPAKDEQDRIAGCIAALQLARRRLHEASGGLVRSDLVVVLDDCHDRTAEVVAAAGVTAVPSTAACVGSARRLGVATALAALDTDPLPAVLLASTDADCLVPPDWLVRMVAAADLGAEVVLGTVLPMPGLDAAVYAAWSAAHDVGEDHPHVHAANLGIRADRYLHVGGWRELACHEDVDLVQRAEAASATIRRCGELTVRTSSRLVGRVPGGFAGYLRELTGSLPAAV